LLYLGLGVQLAASVGLGVFGGQWLDRRVGTDGIFVLLGGLLGFAGTMVTLVRTLTRHRDK
jgi:F0F1-type ATP synthase assembly protein I